MQPSHRTFDISAFFFALRVSALVLIAGSALVFGPKEIQALAERAVGVPALAETAQQTTERLQAFALRHARTGLFEPAEARAIGLPSLQALAASSTRFVYADLDTMRIYLYENGTPTTSYPILSKGKTGSRWQTPTGLYKIETKEKDHFSSIGEVHMPYSMEFFGNFFIHGWPYYPNGTPVPEGFSGGCIRLTTEDAAHVYAFADRNMPVLVTDAPPTPEDISITTRSAKGPKGISAKAYLLADVHTGRVYFEHDAMTARPIASITKLMSALVANETIHYDKLITVTAADAPNPIDIGSLATGTRMTLGDAFYPLLMESNNAVASAIARKYGTEEFIVRMNDKARAIGANSLRFADASGVSPENAGTVDDLFRLARYTYRNQSFILGITRLPHEVLRTNRGARSLHNFNLFGEGVPFIGGKVGETLEAQQTMVALFEVPVGIEGAKTTVVAVVLGSKDRKHDILQLVEQFQKVATIDTGTSLSLVHAQPAGAAASSYPLGRVIAE